jgi:rSAM/selenodomain-associated transferase 2
MRPADPVLSPAGYDRGVTQKLCLSVVIPTLNAATVLPATLRSLGPVADCLIVDGGSRDHTMRLAAEAGVRVLTAPRGRGSQIAAGVAAARQDWLLLLHADTRLDQGWHRQALHHMTHHPSQAGYFRFTLDSDAPQARRLERMVAWRCRVLALPYGDQGLLIHRRILREAGGIRPLPLMEDIDLVRRLGRRRLAGIDTQAVTSAKKWERDGWYTRSARNLACLLLWWMGVPPAVIAKLY